MFLAIAYQIVRQVPAYKKYLEDLISSHGLTRALILKDYNIIGVLEEFLLSPLQAMPAPDLNSSVEPSYGRVNLIDALDECDQEAGKNEIIFCI